MKLIKFGKIDKKFFIYILATVITETLSWLIRLHPKRNENNALTNVIMLNKIIDYGSFPFYGILELILRKRSSSRKKMIDDENKNTNSNSSIKYLFNLSEKSINKKNFLFAILFLFSYYIYSILCDIFISSRNELLRFGTGEYYDAISILYLYLILRFINKATFYKHHHLSIFILIFTSLLNYFLNVFVYKKDENIFNYPDDLACFIPLIIFPIFDSYLNYFSKYIMAHYYFSPFFLIFSIGIMYVFLSLVILIIFLNVDCGNTLECLSMSVIQDIPGYAIFLYVLKSILFSLTFLVRLLLMNDFTLFHIIALSNFIMLVENIYNLIQNFIYYKLIIMIITFSIEVFFLFVLFEIIELNFCGLNHNLKKSIINRSRNELELLLTYPDEGGDANDSFNGIGIEENNEQNNEQNNNSFY